MLKIIIMMIGFLCGYLSVSILVAMRIAFMLLRYSNRTYSIYDNEDLCSDNDLINAYRLIGAFPLSGRIAFLYIIILKFIISILSKIVKFIMYKTS